MRVLVGVCVDTAGLAVHDLCGTARSQIYRAPVLPEIHPVALPGQAAIPASIAV